MDEKYQIFITSKLNKLANDSNKLNSNNASQEDEAHYFESKADFESKVNEQELKHKDANHAQQFKNEEQNRALRYQFANNVFGLTVGTLIAILFLIVQSGIAHLFKNQFLSDKVIIALLWFAGVDMFGLFAIILAYLFKKQK